MPSRIGFHVIYATSEVPDHLASELGWAGPASRGWRSAPGLHPPHDLVLQLECRVAITRVQLLAHHYLIPKRIEILVHDSANSEGIVRTPSSPQYEAIGWIGLTEGCGTGDAARELRTASIPRRPAAYLRLRLSEPYKNEKNVFNQVALMGVNIFGEKLLNDETIIDKIEPNDNDYYSPYDDLAFIMYVDNEIGGIIRKLEAKKQCAISAERFEYARKLKVACDILSAGGRVIGGWQLQKRIAAAAEQYERATRRRDAITHARISIAKFVNLDVLLESNGANPQNDEYYGEEKNFSLEMLRPSTSNLSFDLPSPRAIMESPKQDHEDCQEKRDISNLHAENISISDRNFIEKNNYSTNNSDESLNTKKILQSSNNIVNADFNIERTMSPFTNEQTYITTNLDNEKHYLDNRYNDSNNYIKDSFICHQNNVNVNDRNKICFDDSTSHFSTDGTLNDSVEFTTKKIIHEPENMSKATGYPSTKLMNNACDNSYFNSPANSVSPTNLHYNSSIQVSNTVVKRRNRSAGPAPPAFHRSSYEAYEERLVPTLRHSHTNEYLRSYQNESNECHKRSKLGEKDRKQAALPILIFGEELVEKIYSKQFIEKEEGLHCLKITLQSFHSKLPGGTGGAAALSPNKAARAATLLLHRALRDPVFSVYSLAAELIRIFFTEFITERVNTAEISRSIERLVPELIVRSGDPAPRIHSLAMHTILTIAEVPAVRGSTLIPTYLVRPLTAGTAPRLALSRLLMVEQLLLNHGIDKNSGLKARAVAELGAGGLTHGQGAVRRAAERLLMAAYERAPRLVRGQLPPDDPVTRRNLLYRHLFEGFDRIDRRKRDNLMNLNNHEINLSFQENENEQSSEMTDSMMVSHITNSMCSSMGSSMMNSLYQPKSSIKKHSVKKYGTNVGFNGIKNDNEYPGYNKLRLDSAVSPKHQLKANKNMKSPRSYVLEKNYQNSIQNNNLNTQNENAYSLDSNKYQNSELSDDNSKHSDFSNCKLQDSLKDLDHDLSLSTKSLNSVDKNSTVVRNLHSNIIFDNKMSYSGSENMLIQNGIQHLNMDDNKKTSPVLTKSDIKKYSMPNGSPGGTLKTNKKVKDTIFRSKSGSNVPSYFSDNFDSFDNAYNDSLECDKVGKESIKYVDKENKDNYHSGINTPDVYNKAPEDLNKNMCPFCFANVLENILDAHYWRVCPLLCRCIACRAPLEVRVLSQHLIEDCSHKEEYKQCSKCLEAIELKKYQEHIANNDCIEIIKGYWKCPFCHTNILNDDDSWRLHLSGTIENSCRANPRLVINSN